MTDSQSWVASTYERLAGLLAAGTVETWDAPSLCEKWLVRHVIAHVTMPARLTPEQFGAEMAAAGGDFTVLSDTVAARDAALPLADLLDQLRSPKLHAWQPPGGGAAGALSHAVIHSLDVTIALDRPTVAPQEAVTAVLDRLAAANGALFGVDLTDVRLAATDTAWRRGSGRLVRADSGALVALLSGRTLPDRRVLPCAGERDSAPARRR
ncbi:maleylpyruvate isomerase family mycothiol-dependent enzyme [Micromonospora sp. WMMD1082]|uniref:maleylpyruvate isomerase family mycothiol-dependent enzyme n=1 Tax=Micromonospora sp. WMMD1082 TaxID=3016104 RepID=UPI002417E494|nr:maleylpyruvate isomerase family mycothiol-dependent enzyme [Micromonospora sp. WMMD1082]MDG4796082.1 maleylpyruvate isomerase family mycothiol-dependent enzyme [Micromonospora sp. WMMD1082]